MEVSNPGDTICLKKKMVKTFCYDLKRKMKITCNQRPNGTNASNTTATIVTNARTLSINDGTLWLQRNIYR